MYMGSFAVEIKDSSQAESIVSKFSKLDEKEKKSLLGTLQKGEESMQKQELTHEHLLNKPNMTAKDKANMEKSIKFLVDKKMDTSENLKKLEAINYGSNYIEIGEVKRARENLKAEPNKNIFKHGDEVYFKSDALEEQNETLAKQGMKIPGKKNFVNALKALPGDYSLSDRYAGANILGTILDLSMSGLCRIGDEPFDGGKYGYVWASLEGYFNDARYFKFDGNIGTLDWSDYCSSALAVRPVLK